MSEEIPPPITGTKTLLISSYFGVKEFGTYIIGFSITDTSTVVSCEHKLLYTVNLTLYSLALPGNKWVGFFTFDILLPSSNTHLKEVAFIELFVNSASELQVVNSVGV